MDVGNNTQPECIDSSKSNEYCGKCIKQSKEELLSFVIKCANFAAEKHRNQRRKDIAQTPYINHPLGSVQVKTI